MQPQQSPRLGVIILFFVLNSAEHEISSANQYKNAKNNNNNKKNNNKQTKKKNKKKTTKQKTKQNKKQENYSWHFHIY